MGAIDYFKGTIIVMLFYSFCITMLAYAMPAEALQYNTMFSQSQEATIDLDSISQQVEGSLQDQTNIPVIELGALVFYSGNILLDLLLNFAFALPQMFSLLINGFLAIFNIDSGIAVIIQGFASGAMLIVYFISLIQMLTNVRSGRIV